MTKLLQRSLDLATAVARTAAQLVEAALDRVRGGSRSDEARWTPAAPPSRSAPVTPREPWTDTGGPVTAPETPPPPPPRPPAPAPATPSPAPDLPDPPPIAAVPEPTPGEAARVREQRREAETTAESPGAEVHVDEPWQGYASMNAPEIIDRLAVSDAAVKAVVLLYEGSHRGRKTVLRAAGR
jgi:outer membrane biosynthesis protein TonB